MNLLERETLRLEAGVLLNPVRRHHDRHHRDEDRDCSLRVRGDIRHNKNYIHHKNLNIPSNPAVEVLVLKDNGQILGGDMIVGTVLVDKWKQYGPRAFVAFSGFGLVHLGIEPERVVWQTNFGQGTLQ